MTCVNTIGSFDCICSEGFFDDGLGNCAGTIMIVVHLNDDDDLYFITITYSHLKLFSMHCYNAFYRVFYSCNKATDSSHQNW